MILRADLDPILATFQLLPEDGVVGDAIRYTEQFSKPETILRFCAGVTALAIDTKIPYYCQLSTALFDIAEASGMPPILLMPGYLDEEFSEERSNFYSIDEASKASAKFQERGLTVGLLHGHFRVLTPANWANISIASEKCNVLILGIEQEERTRKYKARPLSSDTKRAIWILSSGFNGCLCLIEGIDYTNQGYTSLVKQINPTFYFGNSGNPEYLREQMGQRALNCGVGYTELIEQSGFHTSDVQHYFS